MEPGESEELTLKEAGALLGLTPKGVQALINRGRLASELRQAPFGTPYRAVRRADVEDLARKRAERAAAPAGQRGRGRLPKAPADVPGGRS